VLNESVMQQLLCGHRLRQAWAAAELFSLPGADGTTGGSLWPGGLVPGLRNVTMPFNAGKGRFTTVGYQAHLLGKAGLI
jgi:hypothetical protein